MPAWNSGSTWNSGALWGPASPPPPLIPNTPPTPHPPMKRQEYYPTRLADQPEWHFNYADRLAEKGADLGLVAAAVTASVNDSRHLGHALGAWLTQVREFGPGATGELETLRFGTGLTPFELPVFTPPAPPAGLTPVLPGALARLFKYVQAIKAAPGYTEGIGLLLGIVGSEAPPPPPGDAAAPRITVTAVSGPDHQRGRVKFFKDGHQYIIIDSRRGGAWEQLVMAHKSPHLDDRPLLVAGQAEVREYRARFFDNGATTSDWCDVAKITVGP